MVRLSSSVLSLLLIALFFTSCATENPIDRSVTLIVKNVPKGCKHVGIVSAENLMRDKAISGIKQVTQDLGGNFVKITKEEEKSMMTLLSGDAYFCE